MFDGFFFWKSQSTHSTFGAFYRIEHLWIKNRCTGLTMYNTEPSGDKLYKKKICSHGHTNVHILLSGIRHDVLGGILYVLYSSRHDDQGTYDDRWKRI